MDQEAIIRRLAAALPEAFAGRDLREEYAEWGEPEQDWLAYIAVPDARTWIERNALDFDHDACVQRVRPGGEDAQQRRDRALAGAAGAQTQGCAPPKL